MSRDVYTYRGHLVISEVCGCRHANGSFLSEYKADEGKLGMCQPCALEWRQRHEAAALEHAQAAVQS